MNSDKPVEIQFTVVVGVRGPIEPGNYVVRDKRVTVSYPTSINLGFTTIELPKSLATMFIVAWRDASGYIARQLKSKSYERHLPIYVALDAISELLLAYKLVRIGHAEGRGLRTIGIGDTLVYCSSIDGVSSGDLNVGLKNFVGNSAWSGVPPHGDAGVTSQLAVAHIGTDTMPIARRYVRCYELLEHGFYSEAFIVAFSVLDDFVQETLYEQLRNKGLGDRDRKLLLRGIKENRLKLYLGPLLKLAFGQDIAAMWPDSEKAIDWLNTHRNDIAHSASRVDYATAAKGIYVCLRVLVAMKLSGVAVDLSVELFRHAKITAAWTANPPTWIPVGPVSESMDFDC
jgi:hypothetical protein